MKRILLLSIAVLISGCTWAGEGSVLVKETTSGIQGVTRPSNGIVSDGPMTTFHEFDTKAFTVSEKVATQTKDNARLTMDIQVTLVPPKDDDAIIGFCRKFGLKAEDRTERVKSLLHGHINDEGGSIVATYNAYDLMENKGHIQEQLKAKLAPILKDQMWLTLESIQLIGTPDFQDDRIETAASAVVANQKEKEAAEARLATAKVEAEKKAVEAQTFKDPALLQIKILELKLEIEKARAHGVAEHKGNLTIIEGSQPTQLHLNQ